MFSIRMRAAKEGRSADKNASHRASGVEIHLSGAEGIYSEAEISEVLDAYVRRALGHVRGRPDRIELTIERLREKPVGMSTLPVVTVKYPQAENARDVAAVLLKALGVSARSVEAAMEVVSGRSVMRGAALIRGESGRRAEPDLRRGVRASRFGIRAKAEKALTTELAREAVDVTTVKEALLLASKVASCSGVIAELCVSDDPDYTTGYVASREYGYVRLPKIKRKGSARGGRVFFLSEDADAGKVIRYLEKKPVMIGRIGGMKGTHSIDEILNRHNL